MNVGIFVLLVVPRALFVAHGTLQHGPERAPA